ncbi:MAG: outer membrane immunogenic protein [Candidatus Tokpelaia sp. JSC189]|nr:MAG: outer membrane immunogenic protein [Candidatus Tokpelaia sp. JSC189]
MKIKYLLAVSTVALIANSTVYAADIVHVSDPVVSAATFNWDGFYAGGQIGGSWARSEGSTWNDVNDAPMEEKPNGFVGGLYAGYNFDVGSNIIFGADTDFVWSGVKGTDSKDNVEYSVQQNWAGSTRLRAGYAMDCFLPYLAGGVAYSKISNSVYEAVTEKDFTKSKDLVGWTVGVGIDYAMVDNILLRAEYRYTDFGKSTYSISNMDVDSPIKYNSDDFRVGIAYKF